MNNNFSNDIQRLLERSKKEAIRHNNDNITPAHLLMAMLSDIESAPSKLIEKASDRTSAYELRQQLDEYLFNESTGAIKELSISDLTNRIVKLSVLEARLMKVQTTDTIHILLALFHNYEVQTAKYMQPFISAGITYDKLFGLAGDFLSSTATSGSDYSTGSESWEYDEPKASNQSSDAQSSAGTKSKSSRNNTATPVLDKFGHDMTKAATEGRLDPVVGREIEIERLAQILSRRKKNNPVLIGEPGVGKSAIVEGLALRITKRQVPRILFDKRVISLDMAAIVAGTKYRGEFEERIKAILNELSKNNDIILFIDEIHTIVGAGNTQGSMDAANMLKPALARGELQCIGATTLDEYRKNIERDGALERRFQKVMVEPTTPEQTRQILENIKSQYESHHNVTFTDAALDACVRLTERYITDRNFPDKAIDALDEAGSRVRMSDVTVPPEIETLETEIDDARRRKQEAVKASDYNEAAKWRNKAQELSGKLDRLTSEWDKELANRRPIVDEDRIAEVVAMMTGVPVRRIAQAEGARLLEMAPALQKSIIGQDEAVKKIVRAIHRNRVGLKDPGRPIGTFMFLGPTGVGKTHLAKKLADFLFDSSDSLIRIDMSEYMEKFTVSRLVGAPPGYVGYEEGGQLTERVRRHPYSVVLLDEIEKAHPDVFNLLLQVLDEGRLTDSLGRRVDFRNTIIIMTSNVGSRQLKEFGSGIGFTTSDRQSPDYARGVIQKALGKAFSPEFLNRIDDIVTFDPLDAVSLQRIIDIELNALKQRLVPLGFDIDISDSARQFVAARGYDPQFGARPLKRAVQRYIEEPLAELILTSSAPISETSDNSVDSDTVIIEASYVDGDENLTLKLINQTDLKQQESIEIASSEK